MRISSKGRYGLSAMIFIAMTANTDELITVNCVSEKLGISKIYLEQVFSLLKRAKLVISIKGAQGGYQLARKPEDMSCYDILHALEQSLFEQTDSSVDERAPEIEKVLKDSVWTHLDNVIIKELKDLTLKALVDKVDSSKLNSNLMYYI